MSETKNTMKKSIKQSSAILWLSLASATQLLGQSPTNGLRGDYFNNPNLTGTAVTRIDPQISFNWGGGSPDPRISSVDFSVRWTGAIEPLYSEPYTFFTVTDDGVRLWVDGKRIISDWTGHSPLENASFPIQLEAGQRYTVQMEYFDGLNGAFASLGWSSPSQSKMNILPNRLFPFPGPSNHPPNRPVFSFPTWASNPVSATNLAMGTDFFSDIDMFTISGHGHAASEWEIWTVRPLQLVWSYLNSGTSNLLTGKLSSGTFLNSYVGKTALLDNMRYQLRVRHKDNSGDPATQWSEWAEQPFDTIQRTILVESTFNTDTDGWTTWDHQPPFYNATWTTAGGGAIQFSEGNGDGATTFWQAPSKFLGDKSVAYNGYLSFDVWHSTTASYYLGSGITLGGSGMEFHFDIFPRNPGTSRTSYKVALNEQAGWRKSNLNGPAPTQSEMMMLLRDLKWVRIRGEYRNGNNETGFLDNVRILDPDFTERVFLTSTQTGSMFYLAWPTNAPGFQLQWTETLAPSNWQSLSIVPLASNGLFHVGIPATNGTAFFRLSKP